MSRDTDRDWERIANENPYWGVLSTEEFRGADLAPDVRKQFLHTGEQPIADLITFIHQHVAPGFRIDRALEFGCGVGRLLIPLARIAREVVGVDVAPRMLELARKNVSQAGLRNASFVVGDDTLSGVAGEFDFVLSYIVFQHIPPERGMAIMRRLLDLLKLRGVFSLHLTFAKERRFLAHEGGAAKYYRRAGHFLIDLDRSEAELPEGTVSMFDYDLNEVVLTLGSFARESLLLLPTNHDGHIGVNLIGVKTRA
jgi:SAM-dependent methyltransferase